MIPPPTTATSAFVLTGGRLTSGHDSDGRAVDRTLRRGTREAGARPGSGGGDPRAGVGRGALLRAQGGADRVLARGRARPRRRAGGRGVAQRRLASALASAWGSLIPARVSGSASTVATPSSASTARTAASRARPRRSAGSAAVS